MTRLRFDDVSVAFDVRHRGSLEPVHALRHLSLSLPDATILAIVGESGSGKSVMVAALTQTLTRRATVDGAIWYTTNPENTPVNLLALPSTRLRSEFLGREIGIMPQQVSAHLTPTRSIGAQFKETIRAIGEPGSTLENVLEDLCLKCDVDPGWMKRFPHELSGGQAQRVGLALALVGNPGVLIADEPTAGLDPDRVDSFLNLIRLQRAQGRSSLIITHDVEAAKSVADHVGVLLNGHLVEVGPVAQVFGSPAHPWTQQLLAALPSGGLRPANGLALAEDTTPNGATVVTDGAGSPRWLPDPSIPEWTVLGAPDAY
ncbi:ATP-binding cassette domain-containing protein [Stomatohabitans albus]|uniref:ATP-binding cassette domain-containing protein n=1 Tax=Stomatohabitans albus TaxID=3110766 RepID=UPI00300D037B